MSDKAEYYQLKGMVSEMPKEEQEEVARVEAEVLALAASSPAALIGATMAMIKLSLEV
ncbi:MULTISPECIES: hypothetical protein [Pseudomonas]|jgi:hypothetical protein|uniref:hypothetical protein n=1 Tax=Pseudomonas TaxID=286 RepID=UPI0013DEC656|nr:MULTISPECIES: hypothetical protein [Pseudomonas]MEB3843974.1 hypothetical protein [Pseudomonas guariconensis]MEB3876842.1 hypothetical protein [Pseudomonas guariconensis]MEB3881698.1 hypothetical protein [Pseudomonas guariconensis]MEB3898523.1 hypothetical protein [Pseudomonas guariconensis]